MTPTPEQDTIRPRRPAVRPGGLATGRRPGIMPGTNRRALR